MRLLSELIRLASSKVAILLSKNLYQGIPLYTLNLSSGSTTIYCQVTFSGETLICGLVWNCEICKSFVHQKANLLYSSYMGPKENDK